MDLASQYAASDGHGMEMLNRHGLQTDSEILLVSYTYKLNCTIKCFLGPRWKCLGIDELY